jgi:D-ribulokinase
LLCNAAGEPINEPLLYNDARGAVVLEQLKTVAPPNHTVLSATSSLAKLLWMSQQPLFAEARYFLHQADWLGFLLHGQLGISDYHNALKLGYDVENLQYPEWLEKLEIPIQLPKVLPPGTPIAEIRPDIASQFGLPQTCLVCAGTTDSIAAFLASGAKSPGEAVTSLGSTLVLKLLSRTRVEDSRYGIYSHRLGDLWLTGGASNTGGAVLRESFTNAELESLSREVDPTKASNLDYYPLLKPGDRFPINDPNLAPRLTPRPDNPVEFLHGLLESIARIETRGYQLLQNLGADKLQRVYTAGGGAANSAWTAIRQRCLKVPVVASLNTEAAYGSALLAKSKL